MTNVYETRVLRVIEHVHANPAEQLDVERLAAVAALSPFHFHRVFRALTGETLAGMVRRVRMDRAAVALTHGTAPIAEIAAAVGYPNVASFTRAFSEVHGMPPGAYRERGKYRATTMTISTGVKTVTHPVTIRTETPRKLAGLLHTGPYPEVGAAFDRLWATLSARSLAEQTKGMAAVFHDDPSAVAPEALRSHAGVFVDAGFPTEPPLEMLDLPGGRFAVMRYTGPYSGLTAAYDAFYCDWLANSGEEPGDAPVFEVYLNSPADTPPDALVTEIWMLLA